MVETVAKGSEGNSAPSDKGNEATGTYVKVAGLDIDLSQGFVEPTKGLFVREALAGLVRQVEPGTEETIGKYVKPASPRSLVSYDIAVYVRTMGTSGQFTRSITYSGQTFVEYYQYLRPTAKYAGAVLQAVAFAKELTNRGVPWTALAIVYPSPGTRLRRPRVLHVKGIWAYYVRYHSLAGTRYYPEVRLYFTRHVLGLKKRTQYFFDLIILYSSKQVQRPASRQELVEKAMAQTPPPQVQVVPAQPRAQSKPQAQPAVEGKRKYVAEAQEAQKTRSYVTQVEAQPTAQPAVQAQPEANNGPPKELEESYREELELSGVPPEEIERLLKEFRERWKRLNF
jgi:hypothetical protein